MESDEVIKEAIKVRKTLIDMPMAYINQMEINKTQILDRICYSSLVYERINKKLHKSFSQKEIEKMIFDILCKAPISQYQIKGKNIYVTHPENDIRITINSSTYRVITVDQLGH